MARKEPTGWVGWVYFASAMMLLAGGMEAIAGLVALFKDDFYVVAQNSLLAFSYTTWGWVHIAVGALLLAAGFATMAGKVWGRSVGVIIAVLSALANLAFIQAYPLWGIIGVAVNVAVIYALTAHGSEVRE